MSTPTPATNPSPVTRDSQPSTFEYCSTGIGTPDTFLPGLDVIPQVNSGKAYDDVSDVGAVKREYDEQVLPEDQDFELVLRDQPGNPDQRPFTNMVESGTSISIKITRSTGKVQEAVFLPHDYYSGESGKDSGKQMFACIGKLQEVQFSTVTGA